MEPAEFSWNEKDCIVIEPVDATAIYVNPENNIVIRQRDPMGDFDAFVVIPRAHLQAVITALQVYADEG